MKHRVFVMAALALVIVVPAFAQGQGQGQGQGQSRSRRGGFGGPLAVLAIPEVQKELKMDQAQMDLVQGVIRERSGRSRQSSEDLRNMSREEREKRFAELRQEQEKKVAEVLDKKQLARLKQLEVQQTGPRALDRKGVADALKLSEAQRQKVQAEIQAERDAMRTAFEGLGGGRGRGGNGGGGNGGGGNGGARPDFTAIREKMTALRTAGDAKLNAILTDPQKKQFQQMQGAPFKFPERRFGNDRQTRRSNTE